MAKRKGAHTQNAKSLVEEVAEQLGICKAPISEVAHHADLARKARTARARLSKLRVAIDAADAALAEIAA